MATLINNAGVQHYANKMVLAENRKVGSKSIPTALNDIDNLIDEMKTHFDAEYGSSLDMKLENNDNVFSVGTGTNVDKRSEVENSFTDLELSGNSLVNLVSSEIKSMTSTRTSGWHQDRSYGYCDMIKPNTTYTVICQVFKNTLSTKFGMGGSSSTYNQLNFNTYKSFSPKETGIKISVVQSYGEWDKQQALGLFPQFGNRGEEQGLFEIGETVEYRFMVLEGDYSNKPLPYFFNGLKSVVEKEDGNHKISISSVGKNLINPNDYVPQSNVITKIDGDVIVSSSENLNTWKVLHQIKIKLKKNTRYTLSRTILENSKHGVASNWGVGWIGIYRDGNSNDKIAEFGNKNNQDTPASLTFNSGEHNFVDIRLSTTDSSGSFLFKCKLQLEEATTPTEYEPHKSDKKEISLNEPLRGLPNGIRDTIEKINGEWKIVRRCGEAIINGSLTYYNHSTDSPDFDEYKVYDFPVNNIKQSTSISDRFPQTANDRIICVSKLLYIRFGKEKQIDTLEKCQQWFETNPTKVIYELETPIIEDISPITLQCWKNGTISIDEVLPVETTHTVALNKPAQIKRNIEELTALRKRVQALEDFYDQVALEQAHQLSLINHSIELDYDI